MNTLMPTPTDCRKCGRPYYGAAGLLCDECERMTTRSWSDSPIHEQIRAAGLDPISERASLDATACCDSSGVESAVCGDIAARQWLQHAYEECLDQAVYLKRAMAETAMTARVAELETQLAAARKALTVCDVAMMGKVNPKSVAFKMIRAIMYPENERCLATATRRGEC